MRSPVQLALVSLVLIACLGAPGCRAVSPGAAAFMAVATGAAVGAAVHNRSRGGCYGLCGPGTACDPVSGYCVVSPCGQCGPGEQCDASQNPPRCLPVVPDGLHIEERAEEDEDAPGPDADAPAARPTPLAQAYPGCLRATHVYPAWPTPADYQPATPLFFVRFNRPLNPERVIALSQLAVGGEGWKGGQFFLRDSFLVACPAGTCTDLFFAPDRPLPPKAMVTWSISGGSAGSLGRACPEEVKNGSYVYATFRTSDQEHPVGSLDAFWNREQLSQTYGPQKSGELLRVQQETMAAVEAYQSRGHPPRASAAPLAE